MAVWLTTQMRRWNMIKDDIDHKKLAESVMLATDARKIMAEQGIAEPVPGFRNERILGKDFNSNEPDEYLRSLATKRG